MTLFEILKELCDADPDCYRLYRNYSGRGMMGDKCVGIVCSNNNYQFRLAADAMEVLVESSEDIQEDLSTFLDKIRSARTDSLGRDAIVYWPGETVPEGDESESEDDESEDDEE